tara:strand:- start:42 stop:449 length:408 start_codon:yes stop_codon:yes gene_type:complete
MTEEEYWRIHGEYKPKKNIKNLRALTKEEKKKKSSFDTREHFPSQSKATTEIDSDSGKGKNSNKTNGTNTGKNWGKALGAASDVFGDLSKMSTSPSLSGGGQIQSQGGPEKVAFRSDQYDKEAQRILKKLGNPYA